MPRPAAGVGREAGGERGRPPRARRRRPGDLVERIDERSDGRPPAELRDERAARLGAPRPLRRIVDERTERRRGALDVARPHRAREPGRGEALRQRVVGPEDARQPGPQVVHVAAARRGRRLPCVARERQPDVRLEEVLVAHVLRDPLLEEERVAVEQPEAGRLLTRLRRRVELRPVVHGVAARGEDEPHVRPVLHDARERAQRGDGVEPAPHVPPPQHEDVVGADLREVLAPRAPRGGRRILADAERNDAQERPVGPAGARASERGELRLQDGALRLHGAEHDVGELHLQPL